ncbi:MAG: ABC transporter permease [Candidatus Methylophosphatis roskildensis]
MQPPRLSLSDEASAARVILSGTWTLAAISPCYARLSGELAVQNRRVDVGWDLDAIEHLDSVGASMLWRAWGGGFPADVALPDELRAVFERIRAAGQDRPVVRGRGWLDWLAGMGGLAEAFWRNLLGVLALLGRLVLDAGHLLRHPGDTPWREISANLYKAGARALPVTSLVAFLIGVVLSYLSALQLNRFGADVYIVNLLGIGIIRELGPVLVAVLVAGRSGSAMTAQLGVMRVTEEIDALATMGVSRSLRLVFPKVLALAIAMPLITAWTSAMALIGGMVAAQIQVDISYGFFIETLPKVVPVANVWIGLAKGLVFGFLIALLACHFGLQVKPNTESLSSNTTRSVVTAITVVILVDAVFAIATRSIGID